MDDRSLGYALGASEYLTKPIDRERLVAVLTKYRRDLPVLVVDDDADLAPARAAHPGARGLRGGEAENGRVALERAREASPGLVVLDLMMPEMDGFEFVARVPPRRRPGGAVPIIVVTAKDLTDEDRERLNGGVERILQKGAYTREALLREVRDLVAACVARGPRPMTAMRRARSHAARSDAADRLRPGGRGLHDSSGGALGAASGGRR